MRIVVVSDAHFDARTAGVERFDEVQESFEQAVRFAEYGEGRPQADLFVFCGDLCDGDDGRDVLRASAYACRAAVRLAGMGIKSLWVSGNHDVVGDGVTTTLEPLRALEHLYGDEDPSGEHTAASAPVVATEGPKTFLMTGGTKHPVRVLALPYSPFVYDAEDALASVAMRARDAGESLLVFGHLMLPGMHLGSESAELARGKDRAFPLKALRQWKPAVVVNGHYHRRQVTEDGIQIVGSLCRLTFGEEQNEPGFLVIDI